MIQDNLYFTHFKFRWLRITNTLKNLGYDYSHINIVPEKVTEHTYDY